MFFIVRFSKLYSEIRMLATSTNCLGGRILLLSTRPSMPLIYVNKAIKMGPEDYPIGIVHDEGLNRGWIAECIKKFHVLQGLPPLVVLGLAACRVARAHFHRARSRLICSLVSVWLECTRFTGAGFSGSSTFWPGRVHPFNVVLTIDWLISRCRREKDCMNGCRFQC